MTSEQQCKRSAENDKSEHKFVNGSKLLAVSSGSGRYVRLATPELLQNCYILEAFLSCMHCGEACLMQQLLCFARPPVRLQRQSDEQET